MEIVVLNKIYVFGLIMNRVY